MVIYVTRNSKSNSHKVHFFYQSNHTFMDHEMVDAREGQPIGNFIVNLLNKWCECEKYQTIHMSCSHIITRGGYQFEFGWIQLKMVNSKKIAGDDIWSISDHLQQWIGRVMSLTVTDMLGL